MDSNHGPLVLEATTLPTEPQPLPLTTALGNWMLHLPAHKVVLGQVLPPVLNGGCCEGGRVSVGDLLPGLDDLHREAEGSFPDRDSSVVGVARVIEQGEARVRGPADAPHLQPLRSEAVGRHPVLFCGGDLVRVVVGDPHEVVQKLGKKYLGGRQDVIRLVFVSGIGRSYLI